MSVFDDDDKELETGERAGLEAGAGLEIEDEAAAEADFGFDPDDETPSWLKTGRRPEDTPRTAAPEEDDFDPDPDQESWAEAKTPTWLEIDAEFWAEENETGPETGERFNEEEPGGEDAEEAPKKLVVVHESQRTRRTLIIVAAIAACVCGISTFMFTNGIGPFAPYIPADTPAVETPIPEGEVEAVEWMTAGEGYKDLYDLIADQIKGSSGSGSPDGSDMGDMLPFDEYPVGGVSGHGEPDVLKTDGSYIYGINSDSLYIARADGGVMELVSSIPQPSGDERQVYFEMFLAGDRLIAVRHGMNESALQMMPGLEDTEVPMMSIWYPFGGEIVDTSIDIFDISDKKSPVKIHTLSQSGTYLSSRMVGDHLYLITTYYGDVRQMKATDPKTFIPLYSRDGEQFMPAEKDILIPPGSQWPCYTVIAGIDATGTGDYISLKAVYGDVGTVYSGTEAVYLARMTYEETIEPAGTLPPPDGTEGPGLDYVEYTNWSETLITKMAVGSGQIEPYAQVKIPGYMLNQFSMDEYEGALRLAMTVDHNIWFGFKDTRKSYNSDDWARLPAGEMEIANTLYILDGELNGLGKIDDIAPGERVNSSRFFKDVAYFTTYNRTEPLFSVDLSDPSGPAVIGPMQIQWLSDYLYPYSDGKLFGLGRELDRETGIRQDLRLTMFDVSDPVQVSELYSMIVGNEYSAADQNQKAILVSADKALIAFPADGKYFVCGYDDAAGFSKIAELKFADEDAVWSEIRGLIIDDTFYVISPDNIFSYAIGDGFRQSGSLRVGEGAGPVNRWSIGRPAGTAPSEDDDLPDGVVLDGEV